MGSIPTSPSNFSYPHRECPAASKNTPKKRLAPKIITWYILNMENTAQNHFSNLESQLNFILEHLRDSKWRFSIMRKTTFGQNISCQASNLAYLLPWTKKTKNLSFETALPFARGKPQSTHSCRIIRFMESHIIEQCNFYRKIRSNTQNAQSAKKDLLLIPAQSIFQNEKETCHLCYWIVFQ